MTTRAIQPVASFGYRAALRRTIPSNWKSPSTSLHLHNLPPILEIPPSHRHLSIETDSFTRQHKPLEAPRKSWQFASHLGDRFCGSYAAIVLEKSNCTPHQRYEAVQKMVTNPVFARFARSYSLDEDLKLASNREGDRQKLKLNESAFETHIGVLVLAAHQHPYIWSLLLDYFHQLFSKDVFPDLIALRSLPAYESLSSTTLASYGQAPLSSLSLSTLKTEATHIGRPQATIPASAP